MFTADEDVEVRRLSLRLGWLNGLLIGLALALGVWASDAISLTTSHVRLVHPSLLLGALLVVFLGALAGWLSAWLGRAWASLLIWLVAAVLMILVVGHQPYEGRSLTIWVADRRSWGLPIYPFSEAAQIGMVLSGFFLLLMLGFLGLIQPYRLEGLIAETDECGRLRGRGWFLLLLPLPLLAGVGLIADGMVNSPTRLAPELVHEAIRTGRTYSGNLFDLSLQAGVNYNAISGVRDQMTGDYVLSIGSVDLGVNDTVFVVADFDNGAWIACRVVADQLSFCYDASQPFMQGFPALIATGQTPEDCPGCKLSVADEERAWLQASAPDFGGAPEVSRLAQWGRYVLMQARAPDGEYAIECLFEGMSPVRLQRCWEVKTREAGAASALPTTANPPLAPVRLDRDMWDPADRLGPPPMSDPPTQVELGHYAYYLSCMVCHGDQGQGLEAWRTLLPEEDRNCWQSRCHAANYPPGGFQLPRYAPPLAGSGTLARYQTAADLYEYVQGQMPWQAPGILTDEEYWQITAYLVQARGANPGKEPLTREKAVGLELHTEASPQ